MVKYWKLFPEDQEQKRISLLLLVVNILLEILFNVIRKEKIKMHINQKNRNKTIIICR